MAITRFWCIFELISQQYVVHGILGGHRIRIEDAPFQVNYGDICGGVMIHAVWAMTSAHCGTEENYIRVGSRHRFNGLKIKILSHQSHPNFKQNHEYDYDVQLLRLYGNVNFNRKVKAIDIGSEHGRHILVAGWGYPREKSDYTDVLHQVKLYRVQMSRCQKVDKKWYNHTLTARMFCAGGMGRDACQGDSGGAAVSRGRVVGISSFGYGCGRYNIPGVYINISEENIREWIRGYTGV
ncbi:trypsin-7-like [Ostrinia furnacalis]|uniref:trypsin-7-like n=1 Tax=Ostrinia furnacalis TaxID=93504 RepID=UPI00103AB6AF|nr:trypsin-7-like [Ostrinia furnacalis]